MPRKSTDSAPPTAVAKAPARRAVRQITAGYVQELTAYADVLFRGGLTGSKEHKRPETVAAVIEVGRDVGLPPTQAIACICIVNGRPSIYGDAGLALIRSSGLLEDIEETYEGEPGTVDFAAVCRVKRVGASRDRVARFSIADAIQAKLWEKKGPWTEYPNRQLMWRARSWACRDEFQDVLCGLIFTEEARDIPRQVETETVRTEPLTPNNARKVEGVEPVASTSIPSVPSPGQPSPDSAPTATAESNPTERTPITDAQLAELARLRSIMLVGKGLDCDNDEHGEQIRAAWLAVLAPLGVTSARDLTAGQAAELIETFGEAVEPFSYPPGRGG